MSYLCRVQSKEILNEDTRGKGETETENDLAIFAPFRAERVISILRLPPMSPANDGVNMITH